MAELAPATLCIHVAACVQDAPLAMHPGALAELVSLSFMRGKAYDHLVVECSGIAEPRLVRRLFQDAQAALYHAYTLA